MSVRISSSFCGDFGIGEHQRPSPFGRPCRRLLLRCPSAHARGIIRGRAALRPVRSRWTCTPASARRSRSASAREASIVALLASRNRQAVSWLRADRPFRSAHAVGSLQARSGIGSARTAAVYESEFVRYVAYRAALWKIEPRRALAHAQVAAQALGWHARSLRLSVDRRAGRHAQAGRARSPCGGIRAATSHGARGASRFFHARQRV